ncbi:hypothetical protein ACZ87_00865 [Candidatus Erwinia dacicola]|uniref:Tetratricopeptide repeat family protein n=1 Tax=Candidatus Erwinia dacicola TaxID=252393 RepID=A0A328TPY8_9GAMM|nr:hypothetical protein ACZ87_00865 [Candidatus Erwinia dacicola]
MLNNYGAFPCSLGQYDAAQWQFSRAIEDSADGLRADTLKNSGYCFLNAGQQEKARHALQTDPAKGMPLCWQKPKGDLERGNSRTRGSC